MQLVFCALMNEGLGVDVSKTLSSLPEQREGHALSLCEKMPKIHHEISEKCKK